MKYIVTSSEMYCVVPVLDDGTGPKEYFYDVKIVEAHEPIEAMVKAVRSKEFKSWRQWQKDSEDSPYVGLTVEEV